MNNPQVPLRTVLVVEDCEDDGQVLEKGLRDTISRSNVVVVHSTTEAERFLFDPMRSGIAGKNPDLLVLDVKVPPDGGLALLQKVRSTQQTRDIPVVMLSGSLGDQDVERLYRCGANSYLDKPTDGQEFVSLVAAAARYWLGLNVSARVAR